MTVFFKYLECVSCFVFCFLFCWTHLSNDEKRPKTLIKVFSDFSLVFCSLIVCSKALVVFFGGVNSKADGGPFVIE